MPDLRATRRQFLSGLAAAATVPVVAFLPKDRGPWVWNSPGPDLMREVWNGDVIADANGRFVGVFFNGNVYINDWTTVQLPPGWKVMQ